MSDREELAALRRMAELESRAGSSQIPAQNQQPDSFGSRALTGALDPVYGVGQLVPRALEQVTSLGGNYPNPVSDAYKQSYQRIDQSVKDREQNYNAPDGIDAARLTGNILSPVNFMGGGAINSAMKAPTLMGKMLGGAAVSGGYSAIQPIQDTENYGAEKLKQTATGAAFGAALPAGGALIKSGAQGTGNIIKGATARKPEMLAEVLSGMKDAGNKLYKQSEAVGAYLTPDAARDISKSLSGVIKNPETAASKNLYKSTMSAIKNLNDDLIAGNTGLETLDAHRQILGNVAKDIANPNKAQEAQAARVAIDKIDNIIENLTPQNIQSKDTTAIDSLLAARKQWSKMRKFEKIADIITNAGNDANKLKRDLERFASKPKNTLGWSKDELKALDYAKNQTTGEGLMKMAGKFGFDLGNSRGLGNTGLPILGGGAAFAGSSTIAPALAVPAVGTAARMGQKALARGKAEKLLNVIERAN